MTVLVACAAQGGHDSSQPDKADDSFAQPLDCPGFAAAIESGRVGSSEIVETSGLVASRQNAGVLWAHNDGGGNSLELFAITRNGEVLHTLEIRDLGVVDPEDIAIGPGPDPVRDYLYLADTGDNGDDRGEVSIIRLPEPDFALGEEILRDEVEVFRFRYDDANAHDVEASFVDPLSEAVYVVTKEGPNEQGTLIFRSQGPLVPGALNTFHEVMRDDDAEDLQGSVVGADISLDGDRVALLFKEGATRIWHREAGESIESMLSKAACLAPSAPGQQEAIAFSVDSEGYYLVPEGPEPRVFFVSPRNQCQDFQPAQAIGSIPTPSLQEVSGLALSGRSSNVLWAVNDSGNGVDRNHITAISRDAEHLGDTQLPMIENRDWEDLAIGPGPIPMESYLYIADIGDNELDRGNVKVYRFVEPDPNAEVSSVETFTFEYPGDKPHDAEALMVDPIQGDLYIVTRQREGDEKTKVYRARAPLDATRKTTLEKVADEDDSPDLSSAIVGADISADGLVVSLARRDGLSLFFDRNPEGPAFDALKIPACRGVALPGKQDAIALEKDASGYFQLGEGDSPTLFRVETR